MSTLLFLGSFHLKQMKSLAQAFYHYQILISDLSDLTSALIVISVFKRPIVIGHPKGLDKAHTLMFGYHYTALQKTSWLEYR